jgi:hypothetical protein
VFRAGAEVSRFINSCHDTRLTSVGRPRTKTVLKKTINRRTTKMNARLLAIAIASAGLFITGCSDDETGPLTGGGTDLGSGAMIRVVHLSPDAPAVDIYAEGIATPIITNLPYGQTSAYLDIAPGTYNIQLRAAGSDAGSAPAFETGALTLNQDDRITAVAMGLLSSGDAADGFRVIPYIEGFDPDATNARVRIIHASADAPTVALDVGNDGTPEVTNFARFDETGAAGVALPANTELQIAIWAGSPLERVTVFTTPQLPAGGELFVIASGLLGELPREETGFALYAIGSGGAIGFVKQNPVVFALHGSPDAGPVDILAGSTELVTDIGFGELSGALQVPPAAYTLSFRTTSGATVDAGTPMLEAGERYLAIASGFALGGTPAFTLLPYADGFSEPAGGATVRVIHASPDAPTVDIGTAAGGTVTPIAEFSGLAFTEASASAGTQLPAASLTVGIAQANTTAAVATFDVTTTPGLRAYAVALGSLGGTGEGFRLVLVETSVFPWVEAEVLPN